MRYRQGLLPTIKEAPSDATTASHALLLRAGYIRRMGAGIYSFLPLGVRILEKVRRIVTDEMDRAGGQQVLLPALLPADYFRESGRWDIFGSELFRLTDRKRGDYHLGPTHEEIIVDIARRDIHSYRDLPKLLYQVQVKFRDEPRPRAGLLRCREFVMKDAYSFDADLAGAEESYRMMREAYTRIFDRTGLTYRRVSADAGSMGGSKNEEFQVLVHSGEDVIVACRSCEYAANLEVATSKVVPAPATEESPTMESLDTPGKKSIEEVAGFLGLQPSQALKSLVYRSGKEFVLAIVRGDHEVNVDKLARALVVKELVLAEAHEVEKATGAPLGFAGPVGFAGRIVVDPAAAELTSAVCGANVLDKHLTGVQYQRDYQGVVADIKSVQSGDLCSDCGGTLERFRGIEAGHIFLLGTHYTDRMGATYLDRQQKKRSLVMGCYGVGVSRLIAAAVEQHHDKFGITWPLSIAPFQVHITQLGETQETIDVVADLEQKLEAQSLDVLVDDRTERPGVKFKDADLLGMPLRVTIGDRGLKEGIVELKLRTRDEVHRVPVGEALTHIERLLGELANAARPKGEA